MAEGYAPTQACKGQKIKLLAPHVVQQQTRTRQELSGRKMQFFFREIFDKIGELVNHPCQIEIPKPSTTLPPTYLTLTHPVRSAYQTHPKGATCQQN